MKASLNMEREMAKEKESTKMDLNIMGNTQMINQTEEVR